MGKEDWRKELVPGKMATINRNILDSSDSEMEIESDHESLPGSIHGSDLGSIDIPTLRMSPETENILKALDSGPSTQPSSPSASPDNSRNPNVFEENGSSYALHFFIKEPNSFRKNNYFLQS